MRDHDSDGWVGMALIGVAAALCCAGPLLVIAVASLGVGVWLAAHGAWLLGGLGLAAAGGLLVARLHRRRAAACSTTAPPGP